MSALLVKYPRMRKWLAGFAVGFVALLGGCASGTTNVSLARAQAEGNAIIAGLQAGAAIYSSAATTTPAQAAAVQNVLAVAEKENAVLQGAASAPDAAAAVEAMGGDVTAVLAVLPMDPATKVAIDAGVAVLDAFVAAQASATK